MDVFVTGATGLIGSHLCEELIGAGHGVVALCRPAADTSFVESVRSGKLLNNAEQSAESTITTILGREASYGEKIVTRDEILAANVKLEANLKL